MYDMKERGIYLKDSGMYLKESGIYLKVFFICTDFALVMRMINTSGSAFWCV